VFDVRREFVEQCVEPAPREVEQGGEKCRLKVGRHGRSQGRCGKDLGRLQARTVDDSGTVDARQWQSGQSLPTVSG
jgi:hypothetical protein